MMTTVRKAWRIIWLDSFYERDPSRSGDGWERVKMKFNGAIEPGLKRRKKKFLEKLKFVSKDKLQIPLNNSVKFTLS